jgi:site-specific DNA-methyltransferase (adenine-specific)
MSNINNYKYDWIWKKSNVSGFLNAKKQPMRKTEIISIFNV